MGRERVPLVYVAGPISHGGQATPEQVAANIRHAGEVSKQLWGQGFAVITPHYNTAWHWVIGGFDHATYMRGDLEMLRRCDAVVFLRGWASSAGCREERTCCEAIRLPIYDEPDWPSVQEVVLRWGSATRNF